MQYNAIIIVLHGFRLDYTGIACMIMGSYIPCMYFGFYCQFYEKLVYSLCIMILGLCSIVVSLWDKFATPAFRAIRAGASLLCKILIMSTYLLWHYGQMQCSLKLIISCSNESNELSLITLFLITLMIIYRKWGILLRLVEESENNGQLVNFSTPPSLFLVPKRLLTKSLSCQS